MLPVAYYDGHNATRHAATLELADRLLTVRWGYHERREPLASVQVSAAIAGAPRKLAFADGAFCEVANDAALNEMLVRAGYRVPRVSRGRTIWMAAGASLVAIAVLAVVAYSYGLPRLAHRAATKLSPHMKMSLSVRTRFLLDSSVLKPTALPDERRAALIAGFNALQYPADLPEKDVDVLFRSAPGLRPDAFTLPDGTLVLLDELVLLADNDEQVYAVMGHELGHAVYGHALETALRATVTATVVYVLIRDVSRLFRTVPEETLRLRYSPAFEAQADLYATRLLEENGISASRLSEIREKLATKSAR